MTDHGFLTTLQYNTFYVKAVMSDWDFKTLRRIEWFFDEQAAVDDFQGREAYAKVCADPGLWLVEPKRTLMLGAGNG